MDLVNYYELPGFSNFNEKIPIFLRIWNKLTNIDPIKVKKIVIFYDSWLLEFIDYP